MLTERGNL